MINNISKFKDCYGCTVCAIACPQEIIQISEDKEGFLKPFISDNRKCINCGICLRTCAFKDLIKFEEPLYYFSGWSKNKEIRYYCSSGGISYEIGNLLLKEGYKIIGVKYNINKNRAEHYISSKIKDLEESIGSKYIQSNFIKALKHINYNEKYVIIGTPCQIASIKKYISILNKNENFIFIDFFCHGVPSLLLWEKYLKEIVKIKSDPNKISWRNKINGWHKSWCINIIYDKEESYSSNYYNGDFFYKYFLDNICLNKCCYRSCNFKLTNSVSDIRLGDLWGSKYKDNEEGITGIVVNSHKGLEIINKLRDTTCIISQEDRNIVTEYQMKRNPIEPWIRKFIIKGLQTQIPLKLLYNILMNFYVFSRLPARIYNKTTSYFK